MLQKQNSHLLAQIKEHQVEVAGLKDTIKKQQNLLRGPLDQQSNYGSNSNNSYDQTAAQNGGGIQNWNPQSAYTQNFMSDTSPQNSFTALQNRNMESSMQGNDFNQQAEYLQ